MASLILCEIAGSSSKPSSSLQGSTVPQTVQVHCHDVETSNPLLQCEHQ